MQVPNFNVEGRDRDLEILYVDVQATCQLSQTFWCGIDSGGQW